MPRRATPRTDDPCRADAACPKPISAPLRPTCMRSAALVALALTASCGGTTATGGGGPSSPTASTHDLVVAQSFEPGPDGRMYIEGGIAELVLRDEQGREQTVQGDPDQPLTLRDLSPGDYTVTAAIRPCNANCGNLGEPVDSCATSIAVPDTLRLSVRHVVSQPCEIEPG